MTDWLQVFSFFAVFFGVVIFGAIWKYYDYKKDRPHPNQYYSPDELPKESVTLFDEDTGVKKKVVYNRVCNHCANRAVYNCPPSSTAYCDEFVGINLLEDKL